MKTKESFIASHASRPDSGAGSWHKALVNMIRRLRAGFKQRRKARRDLAILLALDDRSLRDIGLSRGDLLSFEEYGRLLKGRQEDQLLAQLVGPKKSQR